MSPARLAFAIAACATLLALSASNPCHDRCAHAASCNSKLGISNVTDVDTCTRNCEQDTACVNKDEVSGCLADMKCESSLSYLSEALSCASLCKTQ